MTLGILIATLWPFNFFPKNRISWLVGTNGIRFVGPGVVVTKAPLKMEGGEPGEPCSLELLLRPASIEVSDTILNFYTPDNPKQLLLRQWTHGLVVTNDVVNAQKKLKRTQLDVDHAFQAEKLLLLTLTSGPNGTVVYLNGRQAGVFPRFTISQDELSGQIVLGTAAENYQPWTGEVKGLAVYANELTAAQVSKHFDSWITIPNGSAPDLNGATAYYAFTEGKGRDIHNKIASGPDLEIPRWFEVPRKGVLNSPAKDFIANWEYVNDVWRNIAGFIPLGFIFCAYFKRTIRRWQAILYTILAGATLSFTIELLQVYIPSRKSSVTDIITNTLGAALGAILAHPSLVQTILEKTKSILSLGFSDSASH